MEVFFALFIAMAGPRAGPGCGPGDSLAGCVGDDADGGHILIGVNDQGAVIGTDRKLAQESLRFCSPVYHPPPGAALLSAPGAAAVSP
ncbi:MAG: hypothetical protein Q8N94_08725 [Methanoregula sp.]|nr:hypothetical protein [Methanoregula sp.]